MLIMLNKRLLKKIMKYFIVSDIHSFYDELIASLKTAGFDKKNKNHTLIVLGDLFDRGPDALKVYKFLMSIPKKRCILVRGNHELLYRDLLEKDYPESHDFHNHTVDTFCQIASTKIYDFECTASYFERSSYYHYFNSYRCIDDDETDDIGRKHWKQVVDVVKEHPITKLILDDKRWVNYYELNKYILVHSWIPCATRPTYGRYDYPPEEIGYREDWKNATQTEWEDATWGCPWGKAKLGWNKTGKTIVCGHWHTSDFFKHLKNITLDTGDGSIYYSKVVIGIDGGVFRRWPGSYYHPQNVLIIDEDNICYDKFGDKLKEIKPVPQIETVTIK